MQCITVMQPWATLILLGAKRYETRSWRPRHRGPLAIHAARQFPEVGRALCREEPFRSLLLHAQLKSWLDLPTGAVLGTVCLVDCIPASTGLFSEQELALGDFRPGRWAWKLEEPTPFPTPFPRSGRLGIFEIPAVECTPLYTA